MKLASGWPGSRRDWKVFILCWAAVSALLIWLMKGHMANLYFRDPDDALRLVEVRDWISGQSWFDVTQYRVNPPTGGPMHWWRLLDVPIAFGIVVLAPALGQHGAEIVTLSVYPLLLLGLFLFVMGRIGAQMGGSVIAGLTTVYAGTQFYTVNQFAPLRIDHHGWQLILATLLFGLFLRAPTRRTMLLSGVVLAAYLCISLEALPYAVLFGIIPAFGYLRNADTAKPLTFLLAGVAGAALFLTISTRGLDPFLHSACDALTLPYLAAICTSAILFPLLNRLLPGGVVWRIVTLAFVGIAGLVTAIAIAPQCSNGPFGQLDPLVYEIWYLNIAEGQPILQRDIGIILAALLPSLFAMIGYAIGWRKAQDDIGRRKRAVALWLTFGSMLVSLFVTRGMYVANAFAAPGGALLLLNVFRRARAVNHTLARICATLATAVLIPLIPAGLLSAAAGYSQNLNNKLSPADEAEASCREPARAKPLMQLPRSLLFAPIDLSPSILVETDHSVTVTGHHRNGIELKRTLTAFTRSIRRAQDAIIGSGADYLVYCPDAAEMKLYSEIQEHGLLEQLERGDTPAWLSPVLIPKDRGYRIYRIVRTAGAEADVASDKRR